MDRIKKELHRAIIESNADQIADILEDVIDNNAKLSAWVVCRWIKKQIDGRAEVGRSAQINDLICDAAEYFEISIAAVRKYWYRFYGVGLNKKLKNTRHDK